MDHLVMLGGSDVDMGKALQLYVDGVAVLVIGQDVMQNREQHNQILETFLTRHNLSFTRERDLTDQMDRQLLEEDID